MTAAGTGAGIKGLGAAVLLALAALLPGHDRTVSIGRPGDSSSVERFYGSSTHLGATGRWTRGDAIVSLPHYPAPATLLLHVAPPEARVPDAIEVVINGAQISRHTLAAGWNDVRVAIDPRVASAGNASAATGAASGIRIQIRSAVTPSADGSGPRGLFVDRVTLETGGGFGALHRVPRPTWLWLLLICLALIAIASRLGAIGFGFALLSWWALVQFRTDLFAHLPIVAMLCGAAALCVIGAGSPRVARALDPTMMTERPVRAVLLFAIAGVILIALLLPEAWLRGYVLSQADMFFEYDPWRSHVPAGYRAPERPPLGDIPMMVYPFLAFARSRWWEGVFPLWTAAMNAGQPFHGTFQSALFAPLTWVAAIVPLPQATIWIAALRLLVGGVGCFVYLRTIGLSRWASTFGGLTFLLNPYSLVWLEHPPGGVPPWLPWMLVAAERLATGDASGRQAIGIGALAVTTALVLAGGHPHTGMFVAIFGGAYAIVRAWPAARPWRTMTSAAIAMTLGVALVAAQVLPFVEYLSLSHGAIWRSNFPLNPFIAPSSTLVTAIVPNFLGNHIYGNYAGPTNYLEQQIYPGLVTWILAAVGLACGLRRWRTWFFAAAALLAMLVMYGAPGIHQLVSSLPLVKAASLTRVAIVAIASLTILAAYGVDDLLRADRSRRLAAIGTTTAIAAALIIVVLARYALQTRAGFLDTHGLAAFATHWTHVASGLAAAVALIALAAAFSRSPIRSAAAAALVCVAALDLLLFGRGFHPLIPSHYVYPTTPEIDVVRQDRGLFRVLGAGGAFMPNASLVYGLQDVRGYDGLTVDRYAQLLQAAFKYENQVHSAVNLQSPLINLLNVKYVFGVPNIAAPEGWFEKLTDGDAPLYRNTRVFPRAFLADEYVIMDGNPARRTLRDGRVDLRRIALLEQDPPADERPVRADTPDRVGTATVAHYRDHFVQIDTDAPDRRLLVLTDVFYPGWAAAIDGRPAAIHRANFAFRAVAVPPGRHTVTFSYRPASFRIGLTITGLAAAILVGLVILASRARAARSVTRAAPAEGSRP